MAAGKGSGEERSGNQGVGAPETSERELSRMRVADLRERARQLGVAGVNQLRKADLIKSVKNAYQKASKRRGGTQTAAGPAGNGDRPESQSVEAPETSERELSRMRVADLRERARQLGVAGVNQLRKAELIKSVKNAYQKASKQDRNEGPKPKQVEKGRTPDASRGIGADVADSPESSQEIDSPGAEQERS